MSFQDLLDEKRIAYLTSGHQHCRDGWLQLKNCPFCSSENYHLGFNLTGRYFVCWKCGYHWNIKVYKELGFSKAEIASLEGAVVTRFDRETSLKSRATGQYREPRGVRELLPAHREYLLERHFDPEEISRVWQVGGIGLQARLRWRLFIPVVSRGVRVSWTTRAIGDKVTDRYISAPETDSIQPIKHYVYGLDFVRHSVVIVEGPVDAWAVGPGAGALFGTAFTPAQVKLLAVWPRRFVCFDSSPDAQRDARRLAEQLSAFPGVTENIVLEGKDPAESSPKELRLLRKIAGI